MIVDTALESAALTLSNSVPTSAQKPSYAVASGWRARVDFYVIAM
jgi:hypothetical protein